MKKLFIPIITCIGISYNVFAQTAVVPTQGKYLEPNGINENAEVKHTTVSKNNDSTDGKKSKAELKGDKFYFIYDFDKAIEAYASDEKLSVEGQRKLAKSYYNMSKNTQAEEAYSKLITMEGGNLPEDYFNCAMAFKANGKYDEAGKYMDKFSGLKPEDLRAKDYAANKGELNNLLKDNGKYKVVHLDVNTEAQDFGPCYYKNSIVFSSSRTTKINPKTSYRNGKPYLNMFVSEIDKSQLKTPEYFDKKLNGKMNEGPASFNRAGTFMAYTANNYHMAKKELIINFEIYFRTYENDKWSKPEAFALNNKDYSVGHPSLSADGKTMYFSCNKPGGFGAADIYVVKKGEDGVWGIAENLGNTINTEGDEVFPFYAENKEILFFSSNGRFGLGGLDVFSSNKKGSTFQQAVNAGATFNSVSDDFSVIADSALTKGYFSSNRIGGSGDDDIYTVDFLTAKKIDGIAKNVNENPLANIFVTLLNDRDEVLDTLTTKPDGAYTFTVETEKNYKLTGKNAKYNDASVMASTSGTAVIVIADLTLVLIPVKEEVVVAPKREVGADLGKFVGFMPIYFDYDQYKIRPFAKIELDKIVKAMNENPEMTIELNAHTDCRASYEFNQALSDKRANASVSYIRKKITKPGRVTGKGYGETKLINNCTCDGKEVSTCSEDDHQKNRRTEFIITKK